ncbi:MAG: hypothetical protein FWE98_06285 [Oscillospiraceae bacterium]|nr:hypothetical protein [Oscillospiraceae bacterium]
MPWILGLLLRYGYQKLVAEIELPEVKPEKRKYTRCEKPAPEETPADVAEEDEISAEETADLPDPVPQLPLGSDALTADDLQQLIFALHVQAKAGITSSKEKLDQIKLIIFS